MAAIARRRGACCACGAWIAIGSLLLACGEDGRSGDRRAPSAAAAGSGGQAPAPQPIDAGKLDAGKLDAQSPGGGGAPAPLDAGGTLGARPDAAFGLAEPNGPRSTARIVGSVVDLEGKPYPGAAATAGGAASITDSGGYFVLDEVYGETEADVVVRAGGASSTGHVRVPIRAGEISFALVALAPALQTAIDDVAKAAATAGTSDAGVIAKLQLELDAASLLTPWGEPAAGPGEIDCVALNGGGEAAAAPGALLALGEQGLRSRLRSRAAFEVRVAQAGMQLELAKPARFELLLAGVAAAPDDAGAPPAPEHLYWFDPRQGAFTERGELEIAELVARGAIDRAGWWAIGRPQAGETVSCQRMRVRTATGAPLVGAAVRVTSRTGFDSAQLITGQDGSLCWQDVVQSNIWLQGLGAAPSGLASFTAGFTINDGAKPGACGDAPDSCEQLPPLVAELLPQACVRGAITGDVATPVNWYAQGTSPASGHVDAKGAFCVSVARGAELTFQAPGASCTAPAQRAPDVAGICGVSDCLDLDAIECSCSDLEICGGAR